MLCLQKCNEVDIKITDLFLRAQFVISLMTTQFYVAFSSFLPNLLGRTRKLLKKKRKLGFMSFQETGHVHNVEFLYYPQSFFAWSLFPVADVESAHLGPSCSWGFLWKPFGKMLGQIQILACDEILNQSIDLLFWDGQKNSVCFPRDTESYETRIQTMHVPDAALGCSAGSLCLVWSALLSKANLCSTFDICKDQSCTDLWNGVWSSKLGAESHSRPVSLPGVPCPQTRTSFLQHKCINSSESLAGFLP